jgi:hypothetical protein
MKSRHRLVVSLMVGAVVVFAPLVASPARADGVDPPPLEIVGAELTTADLKTFASLLDELCEGSLEECAPQQAREAAAQAGLIAPRSETDLTDVLCAEHLTLSVPASELADGELERLRAARDAAESARRGLERYADHLQSEIRALTAYAAVATLGGAIAAAAAGTPLAGIPAGVVVAAAAVAAQVVTDELDQVNSALRDLKQSVEDLDEMIEERESEAAGGDEDGESGAGGDEGESAPAPAPGGGGSTTQPGFGETVNEALPWCSERLPLTDELEASTDTAVDSSNCRPPDETPAEYTKDPKPELSDGTIELCGDAGDQTDSPLVDGGKVMPSDSDRCGNDEPQQAPCDDLRRGTSGAGPPVGELLDQYGLQSCDPRVCTATIP